MPYRSQRQSAFIHAQAAKGVPWARKFVADSHGTHVQKGKMANMQLGGGGRFAALKAKIAARGNAGDPGAIAASIGRAKYGNAKFQSLAAKGKVKKKRKRSNLPTYLNTPGPGP